MTITKNLKILSIVFGVQLILLAIFYTKDDDIGAFKQTEAFLGLEVSAIDNIQIEDNDHKTFKMILKDGIWISEANQNFPISKSKINEFLTSLTGFKRTWPVAKTETAAKQFELTDAKFEKKITFAKGTTVLKTLYLGTSPSFRKIHAKLAGDKEAYALDFNSHDAPITFKDWMDKDFFKQDKDKIKSITLGNVSVENKAGKFELTDLKAEEAMQAAKLDAFVNTATNPPYEELVTTEALKQANSQVLEFKLTQNDGKQKQYRLYEDPTPKPVPAATTPSPTPGSQDALKNLGLPHDNKATANAAAEETFWYLKEEGSPYVFKVRKAAFQDLSQITRAVLVGPKPILGKQG